MKATEANLLTYLRGPKQLIIPIYQRTYSWSRKECRQLWEDIMRAAEDNEIKAHFIGSIVYISKGIYQATAIPQLLVIDGQQRLTTITLLLTALAREIEDRDGDYLVTAKQLQNYYLINRDEEEDLRHKFVLTRSDKEALFRVVDGLSIPENSHHRIYDNYNLFVEYIRNVDDLNILYQGISKLLIVDVSLDRNHDNPQLIFESLNSTGLDLSQADLIRNFILMGLEPRQQDRLYSQYWYLMEESFGHGEYSNHFDRFMRDYLTIKSDAGTIPVIREIYNDFKKYVRFRPQEDIEEIVADIHFYSGYYVRLAFPDQYVQDSEIRAILNDINTLKVDVAYPFLMETYVDYEDNLLSRDEFLQILQIVESYVFRRAIVGIPTNSLNKTFATLKRSIDKSNYLDSVKAAFLLQTSYRRFPGDEEFWNEFVIKDIYNLRTRRNYLLNRLENYGRKEWVNIEEYTIEHILPQNPNLSWEWQEMLGQDWKRVQTQYLHTIGNLTLTGYNPELSDRPFREKQNMEGGFRDSPIHLNRGLAKLEKWDEEEINNRATELAYLALRVWPMPNLDGASLDYYRKKQESTEDEVDAYTLDHFEYLQDEILQLYEALRTRILNLDASVREEPRKFYIAFKNTTNFADIVPQKKRLQIMLNMKFDQVNDPRGLCMDVTDKGRWGNGDVEFGLASLDDLDYAMFLIKQSFEEHSEEIAI